ncbi:MAG: prolyl oligopeptidase family serine peptidase [Planctomycetia bacterium]|nr:prolyl oligopeptidase family serine peptidase [Planctomycetia bacterium]
MLTTFMRCIRLIAILSCLGAMPTLLWTAARASDPQPAVAQETLDLKPGDSAFWVPIDVRRVNPSLITPGRSQVSLLLPPANRALGEPDRVGPFDVLSVGKLTPPIETVNKRTEPASSNVLTLRATMRAGKPDPQAARVLDYLTRSKNQPLEIVLHPEVATKNTDKPADAAPDKKAADIKTDKQPDNKADAAEDHDIKAWPGKVSAWHGYQQFLFDVGGRPCYVVTPKEAAPGRPWVWRATFPDFHPEVDIALLGKGFFIAYLNTSDMLGSPAAVAEGDKFYDYLTKKHALADKVVLEGVSRGGLLVYNWAVRHTEHVACIYCDTPVLDFKSWPGGKGKGQGSKGDWSGVLRVYKLTEAQATAYDHNPIDQAATFAKAKIPILHIVSDNDRVVPPAENTLLLKSRLEAAGGTMELMTVEKGTAASNGHHFTHPNPGQVVEFVLKHTISPAADAVPDKAPEKK